MTKDDIVILLVEKQQALNTFLENQDIDKWEVGPKSKWTTGQQALHLLQAYKILNNAMSMPKFLLKYRFGKNNREVRDYDKVTSRYMERLANIPEGATFGPSRNMNIPRINDKSYILDRLQVESKKLQHKTNKWKDKDLDNLVIPHPLMGKMPVREIVMWTAFHVEHHIKQLEENY